MYRTVDVQKALLRLIGWRQNDDQQAFKLDQALLSSETGKVFQQAHALLTLQNLRAIAPNFDNYLYNAWDPLVTYGVEAIVTSNLKNYIAIQSSTDKEPSTNPDFWAPYDAFSAWLDTKVKDSIEKAINSILDAKLAECSNRSLVENKVLFDGAGRIADADTTSTGIVGFEIIPNRSRSITARINRIGFQFTGACDLVLQLHHSSIDGPVKKIEFSYTTPNSVAWLSTDQLIPYISKEADAGGSWYIVYDLASLPDGVHPIYKSKDWSKTPCATCDQAATGFNLLSRYMEVYPINAKVQLSATATWDIKENEYSQYNNYGLNLDMSVECDMTEFIISHRKQFANVLLYQFAVDMLREMCYNPNTRVNRNSMIVQRNELIFALDGDTSSFRKSGLAYTLDKAVAALSTDLDGIDRVCLPKKNGGLRYRAT